MGRKLRDFEIIKSLPNIPGRCCIRQDGLEAADKRIVLKVERLNRDEYDFLDAGNLYFGLV